MKLLVINGSYRKDGIIDQATTALTEEARKSGITVMDPVYLRDCTINFCTNCRTCAQKKGEIRGKCPQKDDMERIFDQIDSADVLVLGAPVNFYNVNALTRKFMERLLPYAYWPWQIKQAPAIRQTLKNKKAILVTSSAMPAFLGYLFTGSIRSLKSIAKVVGAKPIGTLYVGMVGIAEKEQIAGRIEAKVKKLIRKAC